jgi:hypothetical protein
MFSEGDYWVGFYGGGIIKPIKPYKLVDRKPLKTRFNKQKIFSVAQNDFPKLPSKIKPPTAEELRTMFYKLQKIHRLSNQSNLSVLNDDWRTQGNWIDRVGRHSAILCAQAGGGLDFMSGYFAHELKVSARIGKNYSEKNDQLRRWVHWIESNDKRVLQCLPLGGRKQAEWDDHKESYPMTLDGPHIYCNANIPQGKYILSLYFFNKDGHYDKNKLRDYTVFVKTIKLPSTVLKKLDKPNIDLENHFTNTQPSAITRVCNFWGGTYKRFLVDIRKDELIAIKIDANYSFNTIVSAVFFDPISAMKPTAPIDADYPPPRQITDWAEIMEVPSENVWWGAKVLDQMLYLRDLNPSWYYNNSRKYLLPLIIYFTEQRKNNIYNRLDKINAKDKERLRSDLAEIFASVQLFDWREHVEYPQKNYESYWWNGRTRQGRANYYKFDWQEVDFQKFINSKILQQTW